jgi:hypothetical protein
MSATNVSIRLGVEGKAEIKRAFEEVGQSAQAAFNSVEKALGQTGAATDREVARLKRLAEAARLAGEADASQKRFNTVLGVDRPLPKSARESAAVFEEATREAESFQARASALRAAIDPLGAAQARLNSELAEYATLAKRGAITSTEHAAAQVLAKQRFDQTSRAITGVGASSKLTRNQLLTLQYTFNDVIASLSTGASPMTILMQQGGQVTQAFGGLRGTIAAFGSSLGVVGGIAIGVAAAVVGLTAAWVANDISTRAVTTALQGAGRASGATADQLERVAHSSAEAGKVSVRSAREMEVAFLRTGKIGAEEMARAIGVARNFAVTMGVETKAGAEQLASTLADPVRGADELNARLAFLDDRTRQYIRTLVDQNNRTEAQRVLLNALVPVLADAEEATNAFGRAWNFVARQASNAFDAIGGAVDRIVDGRSPSEELDLLKWQRDRLRENIRGDFVPLMLPQVEQRIAEIEAQLAEQQRRADQLAAEARANELSVRAGETARDIIPGARELERLQREQAILRAALDDPLTRSKLANIGEVEAAYARVTAELARFRPAVDAATQAVVTQNSATEISIRATLALASAYLESAEAAEHAEARKIGLIEQAREGIDAEARARQALRERIAEQAAQAGKQIADLTAEASAQKRVNDAVAAGTLASAKAQQAMQVEQALRPLLIAQALAEGEAKETLTRIIDRMREAYGRLFVEQERAQILSANEDRQREIELLTRQVALINASVSARGEALAVLRAEQELRRRGVDLASEEARAYIESARQIEALNRTLSGQEHLRDQSDEISLLEQQVALVGASVAKRSEELATLRAIQQLRQRGIDAASPEGQAAVGNALRIAELNRQLAGRLALEDQKDEITLLQTQIGLIGQSASERSVIIAQLRTEQGLRQRGIDLASDEGRAIIENAGKIERLTQELQRQDAAYRAIEQAVGSALDRFADVLAQGKLDWDSWADAGRQALQDLNREMIKLALLNPLKNLLFGSNLPTFSQGSGLLGSIFSRLFHDGGLVGAGGTGRMVPIGIIASAPRFHDGAYLRPDEVPAILQRGERVLSRKEARAYERGDPRERGAVVNVTIQTPNPAAFDASRTQIAAGLARAVQAGMRGL